MILVWVLLLPLLGGLIGWAGSGVSRRLSQYAPAAALCLDILLLIWLWGKQSGSADHSQSTMWIASFTAPWVPQLGLSFSLAMDGLALLMALMSCIVSLAVVVALGARSEKDTGLYSLLNMSAVTAVLGVFLATDLLLFFICFEAMLLPAYALLIGWGEGDQSRSATRFFLFTQFGGLLMLISILALYVANGQSTGEYTFAYEALLANRISGPLAYLGLIGFLIAFACKLPVLPFHTWQPDTYSGAPTGVSILLSALMAKTAGFGLIRYAIPLFPDVASVVSPLVMGFGVFTILYCSWLAFAQKDLKRIVAYSSAAHLGYVVLGVFAMNEIGQRGAIIQMFCHGLSVAGVFLVVDVVERHAGTRDIDALGGLWSYAPRLGALALIFAMATLGLPGLGNFIGEFLTLAGAFQLYPIAAAGGAVGAVLAAAYSLRLLQKVFFGPRRESGEGAEVHAPTIGVLTVLAALLLFAGFFPQPLLSAASTAIGAGEKQKIEALPMIASGERP